VGELDVGEEVVDDVRVPSFWWMFASPLMASVNTPMAAMTPRSTASPFTAFVGPQLPLFHNGIHPSLMATFAYR
jgi:hypothetical protein